MRIELDIRLTDIELHERWHTGEVRLVVRWKCTATFSTGLLDLNTTPVSIDTWRSVGHVAQDDVDGNVEGTVLLVANRAITDYCLLAQHPDYGNAHFDIAPGDVLGFAGDFTFDARKSFDPMQPPLEACFRFLLDESGKRFVSVDTSGRDFVDVRLPRNVFQDFVNQSQLPQVQVGMVVLPALMDALMEIEREPNFEEGGWRTTVRDLAEKKAKNAQTHFAQAQAILDDPVATGLKRLCLLSALEGDD
ncbi:hypothetical protein [Intrasporangium sp.]|uniref:hypothetical protein n=1 Tax=Intrasporangium sp. TaxID=1925024 RepID=UPI0033657941